MDDEKACPPGGDGEDKADIQVSGNRRRRKHDTRVQVAVLRLVGETQESAARLSGITDRTVRRWEADPRWPSVQREAEERFMPLLRSAAMRAVFRACEQGHAVLALEVLSRIDPERFAPPKMRVSLDVQGDRLATLMRDATDEQLARLAAGEDPARVLAPAVPKALPSRALN